MRALAVNESDPPSFDLVRSCLDRLAAGDASAEAEMWPLVYEELRRVAGRILSSGTPGMTIQPTILVHEAWLKLHDKPGDYWEGHSHFAAVAGKAMRQVLLNYARDRKADKRGGKLQRITIDRVLEQVEGEGIDVLELDGVLQRLAEVSARQARIVELRVFGGLSIEDTATLMQLGPTTVKAEWRFARAWLKRELG